MASQLSYLSERDLTQACLYSSCRLAVISSLKGAIVSAIALLVGWYFFHLPGLGALLLGCIITQFLYRHYCRTFLKSLPGFLLIRHLIIGELLESEINLQAAFSTAHQKRLAHALALTAASRMAMAEHRKNAQNLAKLLSPQTKE